METGLSGNELRKAKKRKKIIQGAIEAFQREGFDRASMDLVAKLAGASKRTVYNHFESKKDLLWAVIAELMAEQQEVKQIPYAAEQSLESQLGRFIDAQMYFVIDEERLSIVRLLTSIFVQNEELREEAQESNPCESDPLIPWIEAAVRDKRIKAKNPELAAEVFRGMIEGAINFPCLFSQPKTARELKPLKAEVIAVFLSRYGA